MFEALDRMAPIGPTRVEETLFIPAICFLSNHPQLRELRRKAGLPE
jgi:hypothetical protein